ncbi:hypothetical protein HMPREF0083_05686 [Aneurinibacillus aneurinilyticus ATCC 12856]|uniref:Uncharacterized protein n=1 Tax=Aneurinibacillus aneurinilyticus ATCC 12856 TaxID=649747 RepID=U1WT15_ANEAE|nr:hypothetical protein HMPREF0083_05686 [Aneurinibacillus aneurinilyticus ATCC 12856]
MALVISLYNWWKALPRLQALIEMGRLDPHHLRVDAVLVNSSNSAISLLKSDFYLQKDKLDTLKAEKHDNTWYFIYEGDFIAVSSDYLKMPLLLKPKEAVRLTDVICLDESSSSKKIKWHLFTSDGKKKIRFSVQSRDMDTNCDVTQDERNE